MLMHRFLAHNFIAKTEDDILKQRNFIDHISHAPDSMYVNDVRNLRWCTNRENCNFQEAKLNYSKAQIGNTNAKGYKHSKEAKAKISAAKKGRHWYNNGITNISARECPPGFTSGRI